MNYEKLLRRFLWIFALILDFGWVVLGFGVGAPGVIAIFIVRGLFSLYCFLRTFSKKVADNEFLKYSALWIWLGAVAALMVGNVFLFVVMSIVCMMLYYTAVESDEKTEK